MGTGSKGPGAALVLLRRLGTSTDVLVLPAGRAGAPLPAAAARSDASQRRLVEELLHESGVDAVQRLYGSALSLPGEDGPLGVFVAFVGADASQDHPDAEWMDLRAACRDLAPAWAATLTDVRARFIAQSPDEALRIA